MSSKNGRKGAVRRKAKSVNSIHLQLIGIPDDYFLDEEGEISTARLGKIITYTRDSRKYLEKTIRDFYLERAFRRAPTNNPANQLAAAMANVEIRRGLFRLALDRLSSKGQAAPNDQCWSVELALLMRCEGVPMHTFAATLMELRDQFGKTFLDSDEVIDDIIDLTVELMKASVAGAPQEIAEVVLADAMWVSLLSPAIEAPDGYRQITSEFLEKHPGQKERFSFLLQSIDGMYEPTGHGRTVGAKSSAPRNASLEYPVTTDKDPQFNDLLEVMESTIRTLREEPSEELVTLLRGLASDLTVAFEREHDAERGELIERVRLLVAHWRDETVLRLYDEAESLLGDRCVVDRPDEVLEGWMSLIEEAAGNEALLDHLSGEIIQWCAGASAVFDACWGSLQALERIEAQIEETRQIEDKKQRREVLRPLEKDQTTYLHSLEDDLSAAMGVIHLNCEGIGEGPRPPLDVFRSFMQVMSEQLGAFRLPDALAVTVETGALNHSAKDDVEMALGAAATQIGGVAPSDSVELVEELEESATAPEPEVDMAETALLEALVEEDLPQAAQQERAVVGAPAEEPEYDVRIDEDYEPTDFAVNHFTTSPQEAISNFQRHWANQNTASGVLVENIAFLWMDKGHMNFAASALEAGRTNLSEGDSVLDPALLRVAYRGMHVWRSDMATLNRIHSDLSLLSEQQIETWQARRPAGSLVPYLLFAATFQPTVFAGYLTAAPRLLASISSNFEGAVAKLIEPLVEFARHNQRLDLEALQNLPQSSVDKGALQALGNRIQGWHDKAANKQTGWSPGLRAMRECIQRPEFVAMRDIVLSDDASRIEEVRAFVEEYREGDRQAEVMHELVSEATVEMSGSHSIQGSARTWFLKTMGEGVAIASQWLDGHDSLGVRNDETMRFATKFNNLLGHAIKDVADKIDGTSDSEAILGLHLLLSVLKGVHKAASSDSNVFWDQRRIEGWLSFPEELFSDLQFGEDSEAKLQWLVSNLGSTIDLEQWGRDALDRRNYRHATLINLVRQDRGADVRPELHEIDKRFAEAGRECLQRTFILETLLDNANVSSLLDDARHYQQKSELQHVKEELGELHGLDSLVRLYHDLDQMERQTERLFESRLGELRETIGELVTTVRMRRGSDAIPGEWIEQIEAALTERNITVVDEMIDHLKAFSDRGDSLPVLSSQSRGLFKDFLALESEVYPALQAQTNYREVVATLRDSGIRGDLFSKLPQVTRKGLEALVEFRKHGRKGKELFDGVVSILSALGLSCVPTTFNAQIERQLGIENHGLFTRMTMYVSRMPSMRGIMFFDEGSDRQPVTVILAAGAWEIEPLRDLIDNHMAQVSNRTILLSAKPLSNEDRNRFAAFVKRNSPPLTLYHADPVMLAVVAALARNESDLWRSYIQCALPWAYSNPYSGDSMRPAPLEMRYGRVDDLKKLTLMQNGAATVYGGRQLGKTTLLNEVRRTFHNPEQHQYAFLQGMDDNMDRSDLSGEQFDKQRKKVWEYIYRKMLESGLISPVSTSDIDARISNAVTDKYKSTVYDYFSRDNAAAVLVCMDEIDPLLKVDAARGFPIFRELRDLVNNSRSRFKVVIAGLENVRRFADAPNYPLAQLGGAIEVSIMMPAEAIQLIREPLSYLGYEFATPLLINQVLVKSNRHPGLIHYFCHELVNTLASRHQGKVGQVMITAEDINEVGNNADVQRVISNRFEITIGLDVRYKVIAYSIIAQGTSRFSTSLAKQIAAGWAPDQFGDKMMEGQFEAFLDELCGLGVLHQMRNTTTNVKEYALRNTNILNLVGGRSKVEEKLLQAVSAIEDNDPMSGHAMPQVAKLPSPLTLRDEKQLISAVETKSPKGGPLLALSTDYSVGVVIGSEALGLSLERLEQTLPLIGEDEKTSDMGVSQVYKAYSKRDTHWGSSTEFKKVLIDSVLGKLSHTSPVMVLVEMTGERSVGQMLDMLDAAHDCRTRWNRKKNHRVRIIFAMGPKALLAWETASHLTRGREIQQPMVTLRPWTDTAIAHFLNKVNLPNAANDVSQLAEFSQRWYFSMALLREGLIEKPDARELKQLGKLYSPLLSSKSKGLAEFLRKTGVMDATWSMPLLQRLAESEKFDRDDLELELMDIDESVKPAVALQWMLMLSLVEQKGASTHGIYYTVNNSVAKALQAIEPAAQRA